MAIVLLTLLPNAVASPLPWQAEMAFLVLSLLVTGTPHILDSIRRFREPDHKDDREAEKENQHNPE